MIDRSSFVPIANFFQKLAPLANADINYYNEKLGTLAGELADETIKSRPEETREALRGLAQEIKNKEEGSVDGHSKAELWKRFLESGLQIREGDNEAKTKATHRWNAENLKTSEGVLNVTEEGLSGFLVSRKPVEWDDQGLRNSELTTESVDALAN